MVQHPFQWLSRSAQKWMWLWTTLLTWLVMYCLLSIGAPLKTKVAPAGILSFEFAGTSARAVEMVASWEPDRLFYAGLSLGLDYLFMPLYATSIALGCVLLVSAFSGWLNQLGALLAWGQFVAASLDAIENYALIRIVMGASGDAWPAVAWYAAAIKFALVIAGLGLVLLTATVCLGNWIFRRR